MVSQVEQSWLAAGVPWIVLLSLEKSRRDTAATNAHFAQKASDGIRSCQFCHSQHRRFPLTDGSFVTRMMQRSRSLTPAGWSKRSRGGKSGERRQISSSNSLRSSIPKEFSIPEKRNTLEKCSSKNIQTGSLRYRAPTNVISSRLSQD